MARKKEPERVGINRTKIMSSAQALFLQKGTEQTKMEDIAAQAGICKATLYTYYPNKTAVLSDIALEGMKYLQQILTEKTDPRDSVHDNFIHLCRAMTQFREKFPVGFEMLLQNIGVEEAQLQADPALQETYDTGEQVNEQLIRVFTGAFPGQNRQQMVAILLQFWAEITGLILLAYNKESYIRKSCRQSRTEFLDDGFERLYQQLQAESVKS